jgi:ribosome-associated toxin RatA of RatAB toxin-antitoxin module
MTRCAPPRSALRLLAALALASVAHAGPTGEPRPRVTVHQDGATFVVEATLAVPAPVAAAWDVVTDIDAMAGFVPAVDESRVLAREDRRWRILQRGAIRFGPIAFAWTSEREATLDRPTSIRQVQLYGTMPRLETRTTLSAEGDGTRLHYRVDVIPDAPFPDFVTRWLLRRETETQLDSIRDEIVRRSAPRPPAAPRVR